MAWGNAISVETANEIFVDVATFQQCVEEGNYHAILKASGETIRRRSLKECCKAVVSYLAGKGS